MQGLKPGTPLLCRLSGEACGGLKLLFVSAGIEGYGWGALSIHLLMRYLLGLREEEAGAIKIAPALRAAEPMQEAAEQRWEWEGVRGDERTLQFP